MKDALIITKTIHYSTEDTDFIEDYVEINLKVENDVTGYILFNKTYGDSYHDKGREKVEGIIDFIKSTMSDEYSLEFKNIKVADKDI